MGQEEVLEILKKKREATLNEISKDLKINKHNIWASLMRLVRGGIVERIVIEQEEAEKYGLKRAGRNHIIWRLKKLKRKNETRTNF